MAGKSNPEPVASSSARLRSESGPSPEEPIRFRHERIDANPPSGRLFLCLTTDLTGNGRPDVIVGGMGSTAFETPIPGLSIRRGSLPGYLLTQVGVETDLFWYENPGWERHEMTVANNLKLLGGTLVEFEGGRTDLVVGQGIGGNELYWFRQPSDPRKTWPHRRLRNDFEKYHDLAFGDVNGDGEPELVGCSQESETVFYYDVPADPAETPWPDESRHLIDDGLSVEGIAVADIDGDGQSEVVAGPNVYHRDGDEGWNREPIVEGWDWTRVALSDLDGDGDLEVVLSEGDSPVLGSHPGRVAWFDPPDWEPHVLRDDLFNPHSLQIADFSGDGIPDIYVAEMGLGENEYPRHLLFRNRGDGEFVEHGVSNGVATHEAKAVDLTGNGRPDVVGKSYEEGPHVDVWYNEG